MNNKNFRLFLTPLFTKPFSRAPLINNALALKAPALHKRLFCLVYEALLLFGVVFVSAWLFSTLTEQRHALTHRNAMQIWIFFILGVYCIGFWCYAQQTLAMKTWGIRVVCANNKALSLTRAVLRYLLCWLWILPSTAAIYLLNINGWHSIILMGLWLLVWAATPLIDKNRQFLHDRLAGTRLVSDNPLSD